MLELNSRIKLFSAGNLRKGQALGTQTILRISTYGVQKTDRWDHTDIPHRLGSPGDHAGNEATCLETHYRTRASACTEPASPVIFRPPSPQPSQSSLALRPTHAQLRQTALIASPRSLMAAAGAPRQKSSTRMEPRVPGVAGPATPRSGSALVSS